MGWWEVGAHVCNHQEIWFSKEESGYGGRCPPSSLQPDLIPEKIWGSPQTCIYHMNVFKSLEKKSVKKKTWTIQWDEPRGRGSPEYVCVRLRPISEPNASLSFLVA